MISLYELLEASSGQIFGTVAAQIFTDFCVDVAIAGPDQLFVALRSDQGNTHKNIAEAIERGVSGVICSSPPLTDTTGVTVILVRDTTAALLAWSHYVIGKFGTQVIAVTGSAGKSIAVDAIAKILGSQHQVYYRLMPDAGRLSVPLALSKLRADHRFAVLKLGSNQPGAMAAMVQAVQPNVGVVTHIGDLHTDYFDSPNQLAKEKSALIDYLSPGGLAVLNYDDDLVRAMAGEARSDVKTMGMDSFGADMMAYNVDVDHKGTWFDLRYGSERYVKQWIPLFGQYYLYSVMAALLVGLHYDIPLTDSLEMIRELDPLPGRMNPLVGFNNSVIIDDTYSANPQATIAALDWLKRVKTESNRVFCILGDMENLGAYAQTAHRSVGQHAAGIVDVMITQGSQAALSARAALDHEMDRSNVHVTYSTQDAINAIYNNYNLTSEDILYVKGGATSRMERVTKALLEGQGEGEKLVRQTLTWDAIALAQPTRLTWVEVDTDALANNVRLMKQHIGDSVTLMAVVKADAYGHGALRAARTALLNGATHLGVSSVQEALQLRDAGITAPILTMNYTPVNVARQAIRHNITTTIYDLDVARAYERVAQELGKPMHAHVKVDSGMGRLGTMPDEVKTLFRHLMAMDDVKIDGIYTHFSVADEDPNYTKQQLETFKGIVRSLQSTFGARFDYVHAANTAGTIAHPEAHLRMVRTGLGLYGMHPSEQVQLPDGFLPVLSWKTVVIQVKQLPANHPVGYGNTYITSEPEWVAVLPVGYGDGFRRGPENWGHVLIHGQRAPILGRVSMEKTVVSIDHIPDVAIGDEVVLLGEQRDERITAEELGAQLGTNNYEVTCSILPRVARE